MIMKSGKRNSLGFLFIVVVFTVYWAFFQREYRDWTEKIPLARGGYLETHFAFSDKVYHGHPHLIGWGGDDPKYKLTFHYPSKKEIIWKGVFVPIILDAQDNYAYLVVFDRETDYTKIRFRFYRYKESWNEISYKEFPKSLAKQNTWLKKDEFVDSSASDFNSSLTAHLWLQLEQDKEFYESEKEVISQDFLFKYEKAYMSNSFK